ncbi:PREDICTED: probable tyrosyl-DNA phosphodiesterase [Papilio polytes]|uniref:probable tyrosyl-DNA phosphodiesterase n=1 Tax=Papilio polytes TaxID=76194 RepID=UPI0006761898|nr:PREDICTED: probable tyrosyl-DNA phosphodiesterase [Papilio polytes]
MSSSSKRNEKMESNIASKRVKTECSYGERCYRLNPAHLREFSHPHSKNFIKESTSTHVKESNELIQDLPQSSHTNRLSVSDGSKLNANKEMDLEKDKRRDEREKSKSPVHQIVKGEYIPIIVPTRKPEQFLKVVIPPGGMAAKHAATAPYHIFYTTITDSKETHRQTNSITFLEILDRSLGELKCSLQINFMVEPGWLLAQYYFAGYSGKKLTILYGDDCGDMKSLSKKKPNVDAHYVSMATPFGKHHTKMMLLCYEDGSLRVVISTANLYIDDWENRTQGLWFSPACPPLPVDSMPHDGESPTLFKRSLLRYLHHYQMPQLSYYVDWVKKCDFSHIKWGMTRTGALLRQHCCIPPRDNTKWPLIAQASSLGSYGKEPKLWLTGDFLHHFTKIKDQPQMMTAAAELKLIYPSLQNVRQSHDDLLGGGCLPYAAAVHAKQPWLNDYLYQWQAKSIHRNKAMPHIKSYTRVSPDNKMAAYFLLTSANVSKAAWGSLNKGNRALRIMSYEAGVLFLPKFIINEDLFPLDRNATNRLMLPYDIPPVKYTSDMSAWVSDYLS